VNRDDRADVHRRAGVDTGRRAQGERGADILDILHYYYDIFFFLTQWQQGGPVLYLSAVGGKGTQGREGPCPEGIARRSKALCGSPWSDLQIEQRTVAGPVEPVSLPRTKKRRWGSSG